MRGLSSKKGYVLSPFVLAALVILGVTLAMYFSSVDSSKAKAIAEEGKMTKDTLATEGDKAMTYTKLLFAAYQAAYDAANYKGTDQNPMADPVSLKAFLSDRIKKYLGAGDALSIEIIDKDEIRDQGFIVKASGSMQGDNEATELDVEKFVNARIFLLQERYPDIDSEFEQDFLKQMECRFQRADCTSTASGIQCSIKPLQGQELLTALRNPQEIARRVRDAVLDIQRKTAENDKDGIAEIYNITRLTASIKPGNSNPGGVTTRRTSTCCPGSWVPPVYDLDTGELIKEGYCKKFDDDYTVSVEISGQVDITAVLIDYATLSDDKKGGFIICTESPIMLFTGEIKPLQTTKTFTVQYKITLSYNVECKPQGIKSSSVDITPSNSPTAFPKYSFDASSLEFPEEEVTCDTDISMQGMKCEDTLGNERSCSLCN